VSARRCYRHQHHQENCGDDERDDYVTGLCRPISLDSAFDPAWPKRMYMQDPRQHHNHHYQFITVAVVFAMVTIPAST
jgi:hypothetical protein